MMLAVSSEADKEMENRRRKVWNLENYLEGSTAKLEEVQKKKSKRTENLKIILESRG